MAQRNLNLLFSGKDFSKTLAEVSSPSLAGLFDVDQAREDIEGLPFKDCRSLICRQSDELGVPSGMTEVEVLRHRAKYGITNTDAQDTDLYRFVPAAYAEVMRLAAAMGAEQIGRVAITQLVPGGHVLPHRDYGTYFDHYDRLQIALGGEGCLFRCGDEVGKMLPGEVWSFNAKEVHEVWNKSEVVRWHIVVDLKLKGSRSTRWPEVLDYTDNTDNTEFDVHDKNDKNGRRRHSLCLSLA